MNAQRPPSSTLRRIVELATRAPSVHNTQPWRWRATPRGLELYADRSRQLQVSDPDGRNLLISCGTALHHAQVAARALGWSSTVHRLPDAQRPDLLAGVELGPTEAPPDAAELLDAIDRRCTDRRRFTSWPVPEERLRHLASHARPFGGRALPLVDVSERFQAERLINTAIDLQRADRTISHEQEAWVNHGRWDGIPSAVLPSSSETPVRHPSRFMAGVLDDIDGPEVEATDGLIVMVDPDDDPEAWLRAGEGLSAVWLAATAGGFSVVPLSQVVEVPSTREALQLEVLGGLARPLLVIRVGWQPISRSQLPRTPRRPVDEVLELA